MCSECGVVSGVGGKSELAVVVVHRRMKWPWWHDGCWSQARNLQISRLLVATRSQPASCLEEHRHTCRDRHALMSCLIELGTATVAQSRSFSMIVGSCCLPGTSQYRSIIGKRVHSTSHIVWIAVMFWGYKILSHQMQPYVSHIFLGSFLGSSPK